MVTIDNRVHKRIIKPYIVRYRIRSDGIQKVESAGWNMLAVIEGNLSAGGIFFKTKESMKIDTIMNLKVSCSIANSPLECVGRIAYITGGSEESLHGIGIEFIGLNEHVSDNINNSVEKMLSVINYSKQNPVDQN